MDLTERDIARFWGKVLKTDGCWLWQGSRAKQRGGYGTFSVGGRHAVRRERLAHRVAYELTYGPFPADQDVLHKCDNPPCVNPAHLFLGTAADNMQDCKRKGRTHKPQYKGSNHPSARLSDADVLSIRARLIARRRGLIAQIAREYGVDRTTVSCIAHGKTWQHLTPP